MEPYNPPVATYATMIPDLVRLTDNVDYGEAAKADVKKDPVILGGKDGYIDNVVCTVLDDIWNWIIV